MTPNETTLAREGPLDQLKTIQMLEESLGPKSLRQLRGIVAEEDQRRVLDDVARDAGDTLRELDDVIHEWTRHVKPEAERRVSPPSHLDREEVLTSVIELKESEAQMLQRAAESAPSDELRERLGRLADGAGQAAAHLREIL